MANSPHTKIKAELEKKAVTSDVSTLPLGLESMVKGVSKSSLSPMTATIQNALRKTWTSAELEVLRSKAGLVAGALADFQAAGGLVVVRKVIVNEHIQFPKIILVAGGISININETIDGIGFDLVAVKEAEKCI
jgi:hypothetical protein